MQWLNMNRTISVSPCAQLSILHLPLSITFTWETGRDSVCCQEQVYGGQRYYFLPSDTTRLHISLKYLPCYLFTLALLCNIPKSSCHFHKHSLLPSGGTQNWCHQVIMTGRLTEREASLSEKGPQLCLTWSPAFTQDWKQRNLQEGSHVPWVLLRPLNSETDCPKQFSDPRISALSTHSSKCWEVRGAGRRGDSRASRSLDTPQPLVSSGNPCLN